MKYKKGENAIIVKNIILWFNFFSIYDSISSLIGFCVRRLDWEFVWKKAKGCEKSRLVFSKNTKTV